MEEQLLNLSQQIPFDQDDVPTYTPGQRSQILGTAELYRMAALLYLRRVMTPLALGKPDPLPGYVDDAFAVLRSLPACTSPWPLFVLACEGETDEHRITILTRLHEMHEKRAIGNVFVLGDMVESLWKQKDLLADSGQPWTFQWWDPDNIESSTPWFI